MNPFEAYFSNNKNFKNENGVYYQLDFDGSEFEQQYTDIRTKEGRMYDDDIVRLLPAVAKEHPLYHEWAIRSHSARRLVGQLKKEKCRSLIEVGCGNGWLTNYVRRHLDIPVCGVDVGKAELSQAARIGGDKAAFVFADIFSEAMAGVTADAVLLASCIQYFPDVRALIGKLRKIGTIHIIDSPVYSGGKAVEAKARSANYFRSMSTPGMEKFYYHHERSVFEGLGAEFLYDPSNITGKLNKVFVNGSPFPWIRIGR
ncbi:MAG TPA: class I SAM-dependent methyltransferase [Cyclobacteriaceae bacterium]|nr:class I SAM-dependent methyltransferase [Cyclobacteriaceae bacterium]